MPITYRIDKERGRILTTCAGHVTLPQVMARRVLAGGRLNLPGGFVD